VHDCVNGKGWHQAHDTPNAYEQGVHVAGVKAWEQADTYKEGTVSGKSWDQAYQMPRTYEQGVRVAGVKVWRGKKTEMHSSTGRHIH
jgi:hypothetical protein